MNQSSVISHQSSVIGWKPIANRRYGELESKTGRVFGMNFRKWLIINDHFDPPGVFFPVFSGFALRFAAADSAQPGIGMSKSTRRGIAAACDWNDPVFSKEYSVLIIGVKRYGGQPRSSQRTRRGK